MRIIDVEAFVVANPVVDDTATDSAQDAFIVRVKTDDGISGIGEGNHTPLAMKAFVESPGSHGFSQGIRELLIGQDPLQPKRIWELMYRATIMSGRRGLGVAVLAAIDVALWDIKGKAEGKPVYELLGGASGAPVVPYTTIYDGPGDYREKLRSNLALIERSLGLGFKAIKVEPLADWVPTNSQVVEFVREARERIPDQIALLVDVGYRWRTAKEALREIRDIEPYAPALIETPLWLDDIDEYRRVADRTIIPVAVGEFFVTRNEFLEMMDRGHVDVIQPSAVRVGFTEGVRVAEDAASRGRSVVPFGWLATTISVAANLHLAATLHNSPWCEYAPFELYPKLELRRNLVGPEPRIENGAFVLPTAPGLGVELDEKALNHYRIA
jgi:L-alanine-DL-glutamate epimerase-like enolase superfamily enzyme